VTGLYLADEIKGSAQLPTGAEDQVHSIAKDQRFKGFYQLNPEKKEEARPRTPTFLSHKPHPPNHAPSPVAAEKKSFMRRALDWTSKLLTTSDNQVRCSYRFENCFTIPNCFRCFNADSALSSKQMQSCKSSCSAVVCSRNQIMAIRYILRQINVGVQKE
jgi:hypothetical protein